MLARVPSIPRPESEHDAHQSHVWVVLLTGDEPPVPGHAYRSRTCQTTARRWPQPSASNASMAPRMLDHAARLAPAEQLVTVVTRRQAAAWERELAVLPTGPRVVQPVYRGRAAETLLPLLKIARQDPSATTVILPTDQRVEHDARFQRYVARAVWAVALRPDVPILIGAHPYAPVVDGWIEPGAPVEGLEDLAVRTVKRFVDAASHAERRRLFEGSALASTSILVGRARTLLRIAERTLPEVLEALEPLDDVFGRPEESLLCAAVYECLPEASLAPLERAPELAVLPLPDVVRRAPEREVLHVLAS